MKLDGGYSLGVLKFLKIVAKVQLEELVEGQWHNSGAPPQLREDDLKANS